MKPKRMHVTTVDKDGKPMEPGKWVEVPEPQREAAGLAALSNRVAQLFAAEAELAAMMVFTADESAGFNVMRQGTTVRFLFSVDLRLQAELEYDLRAFFTARDLAPQHDYLAQNGPYPDSVRCLDYTTPTDAGETTRLCAELLRECYGVKEADALLFTFDVNG